MEEQQTGDNDPTGSVDTNASPPPESGEKATTASDYKPNVYQLIFWALTYGVIAGVVLLVLQLVSNYLSLLWGPVFLAALLWGGYRNYLKQKQEWHAARGEAVPELSTMDQIREAARDVMTASQEVAEQQQEEDALLAQRAAEEEARAQQQAQQEQATAAQSSESQGSTETEEQPQQRPPQPPTPPQAPPTQS